ncbi:Uncharacterised protein [Chlamydia trachomatis]|nr:Uncharacterised protein [Chlamydia trachomatis]
MPGAQSTRECVQKCWATRLTVHTSAGGVSTGGGACAVVVVADGVIVMRVVHLATTITLTGVTGSVVGCVATVFDRGDNNCGGF